MWGMNCWELPYWKWIQERQNSPTKHWLSWTLKNKKLLPFNVPWKNCKKLPKSRPLPLKSSRPVTPNSKKNKLTLPKLKALLSWNTVMPITKQSCAMTRSIGRQSGNKNFTAQLQNHKGFLCKFGKKTKKISTNSKAWRWSKFQRVLGTKKITKFCSIRKNEAQLKSPFMKTRATRRKLMWKSTIKIFPASEQSRLTFCRLCWKTHLKRARSLGC